MEEKTKTGEKKNDLERGRPYRTFIRLSGGPAHDRLLFPLDVSLDILSTHPSPLHSHTPLLFFTTLLHRPFFSIYSWLPPNVSICWQLNGLLTFWLDGVTARPRDRPNLHSFFVGEFSLWRHDRFKSFAKHRNAEAVTWRLAESIALSIRPFFASPALR